jgi:anthranilate/para-aminobenzoate synthase component I
MLARGREHTNVPLVLLAREVPVAPDPPALARRLLASGARGVALLHTAERAGPEPFGLGRWSFVAADPDRTSHALDPLVDDPLPPVAGPFGFLPRWIGVVPYEARRALERPAWAGPDRRPPVTPAQPIWHRYPAVAAVDHHTGRVLAAGTDAAAVGSLAAALRGPAPPAGGVALAAGDDEPPARHAERIAAARELIHRGDLYQVNLARRLWIRLDAGDPLGLYLSLARRAPAAFGACLCLAPDLAVVSTSPELLFRAEPPPESRGLTRGFGMLFTAPIKGTRPRGKDATEDRALVQELDQDPKERAELTMIIDVERHDLGRVAEVGTVRVLDGPLVVTHRTVHHRLALLAARARAGASREEVLASMLPSGSVTGAPKVRAMEVIARLEAARRGLYTGGIGFVAHDGGVTLSMAIRTAVLRGRDGDYWTGGGIVADSDPAREVEETRWKALQLTRAAGV